MRETTHPTHRIAYLICNFIANCISDEESQELNEWLARNEENQILFAELTNPENVAAVQQSGMN